MKYANLILCLNIMLKKEEEDVDEMCVFLCLKTVLMERKDEDVNEGFSLIHFLLLSYTPLPKSPQLTSHHAAEERRVVSCDVEDDESGVRDEE